MACLLIITKLNKKIVSFRLSYYTFFKQTKLTTDKLTKTTLPTNKVQRVFVFHVVQKENIQAL